MIFLMTTVLISAIISWTITHKYQEELIDARKKYEKSKKEYEDEIHKLMCEHLEELELLNDELKRMRRG